ncbi:MAG: Nif3-like dinuclear metal center hexameric protein [Syntrophobacteraceae bacterium]|nr:Nif3-like dinuclear metal center hexameric protein [Syntrophobacteraceae bacterium]
MVRVKDILGWIDSWAPFRFAESWDNCGLQVGNPQSSLTRVLVALDPSTPVLIEARDLGCECLVTHHPLLLHPLRAIRTDSWPGSIVGRAVLSGISIIAAHTNLDVARNGTNAQLVELLGLNVTGPLEAEPSMCEDSRYWGMGLVGLMPEETTPRSLAEALNAALGVASVRIAGDLEKKVRSVAVCAGSGGSLLEKAVASGADLFVTGDLKYHDARLAEESGIAVVDIGHFASEKPVLGPLSDFLRSRARAEATGLEIFVSTSETDPLRSVGLSGCTEKTNGS